MNSHAKFRGATRRRFSLLMKNLNGGQITAPLDGALVNPRPDGPLDFQPPDGVVVETPLVTRLLDVVA